MLDNCPLRLLLARFGGWINRRQAQAIEYLAEENRVLKEQFGNKQLGLTDDQRRRLAAKASRSADACSTRSPLRTRS
ncbi:MAG: hypothetical protein ACI835_004315 [Planctomycetota bacterium]|jgi:hypothetical protein